MFVKPFSACIFLALALPLQAWTEESKTLATQLIEAIREESVAKNEVKKEGSDLTESDAIIAKIEFGILRDQPAEMNQVLENLGSYAASEKISKLKTEFQNSVQKAEIARIQAIQSSGEDFLKNIKAGVLNAKQPADLDDSLVQIAKINGDIKAVLDSGNGANQELAKLQVRLANTKESLMSWQDYLQAKASRKPVRMVSALNAISQNPESLLPRSELLTLIEQTSQEGEGGTVESVVKSIQKLDDIEPAVQELKAIQKEAKNGAHEQSQSAGNWVQALNVLDKLYREFLAGLPVSYDLVNSQYGYSGGNFAGDETIIQLRKELIMRILPQSLGVTDRFIAKPDESVNAFLDRVTAAAKAEGDIELCQKVRWVEISTGRKAASPTDFAGLPAYQSAGNQVDAEQFAYATYGFLQALKTGDTMLPIQKIKQQLSLIKRDHPKDYERGKSLFEESLNSRLSGSRTDDSMRQGSSSRPSEPQNPKTGREKPKSESKD